MIFGGYQTKSDKDIWVCSNHQVLQPSYHFGRLNDLFDPFWMGKMTMFYQFWRGNLPFCLVKIPFFVVASMPMMGSTGSSFAQRPRCSWRVASVVRRWFLAPRRYWSAVPRPGNRRGKPWDNDRKTIGKWWLNWEKWGFHRDFNGFHWGWCDFTGISRDLYNGITWGKTYTKIWKTNDFPSGKSSNDGCSTSFVYRRVTIKKKGGWTIKNLEV